MNGPGCFLLLVWKNAHDVVSVLFVELAVGRRFAVVRYAVLGAV